MISISESILSGLFFISNIFFYWESGYFGEAINLKPFIHLWSLSVEEQLPQSDVLDDNTYEALFNTIKAYKEKLITMLKTDDLSYLKFKKHGNI